MEGQEAAPIEPRSVKPLTSNPHHLTSSPLTSSPLTSPPHFLTSSPLTCSLQVSLLQSSFSSCHRLVLPSSLLAREEGAALVLATAASYYTHARLFHCTRSQEGPHQVGDPAWACQGLLLLLLLAPGGGPVLGLSGALWPRAFAPPGGHQVNQDMLQYLVPPGPSSSLVIPRDSSQFLLIPPDSSRFLLNPPDSSRFLLNPPDSS